MAEEFARLKAKQAEIEAGKGPPIEQLPVAAPPSEITTPSKSLSPSVVKPEVKPIPPTTPPAPAPERASALEIKAGPGAQTTPQMQGMGAALHGETAPNPNSPTSIKNAQTDIERLKRGLPPAIETIRRSFGKTWDEAMARIDRNPAYPDELVAELKQHPRAVNDQESATLLYRQIELQNDYGKAARDLAEAHDDARTFPNRAEEIPPLQARLAGISDQLLELYDINKFVGTETARGLSARKMMAYEDYSLANMEMKRREANGGKPLTNEQRAEIVTLHEKLAALQKQLDDVESSKAGIEIQDLINQATSRGGKKIEAKSSDEQFKTAVTTITKNIKEGKKSALSNPIQGLSRLLVELGIRDREQLIDRIHEILKAIDPSITRRETMDAISGYGDFTPLSKDSISIALRGMKGEMQQIAKLEDMASGKPPLKTGTERRTPTEAERQLIKKVNEAKFAFQVPMTDPATQLKSALDTYKTNVRNQISDYEERLRTGNYQKPPKRSLKLDKDALSLRHQRDVVKRKFQELLIKDRMRNQNWWQRTGRFVGEIVNTMRALKASMDLSATLRQGGIIVASHPIRGAKVIPDQLRALVSPKEQFRVEREILKRPNYHIYARDGLNLTEHGQKLSQMEEAYMSRWAEHIPGVAASQRAYTTFLNKLRADSFDAMADWVAKGRELTPDEGKIIANYINVATGRGNIGMRENALVGLNTAFFAPRLVASRFQYVFGQPIYHGLFSGKTNLRGTLRVRALVASEYARFLIAAGTLYTLANLSGFKVGIDPRSTDFGKITIGNTHIDPMAGLLQGTVLLSRIVSGKQVTAGGKTVPIRGNVPYGSSNSADLIARFLRTKLSPAFGTSVDIAAGKNVVGEPVTPASVAVSTTVPLSLNDIYDAMKQHGIPAGSALALASILGIGVNTYAPKNGRSSESGSPWSVPAK